MAEGIMYFLNFAVGLAVLVGMALMFLYFFCGDLFERRLKQMNEHFLKESFKDKTDEELQIDLAFATDKEKEIIAAELLRREKDET